MKALVAGATGFIGAHLVRSLVAGQHPVVALVRDGSPDLWRLAALEEQLRIVTFDEIARDPGLLAGEGIDVCFNLASAGVNYQQADPFRLADGNLGIVERLLDLCRKADIRYFIHVGSGFEYADTGRRITEDDPVAPASIYGAAKVAASRMLLEAAGGPGPRIVVVRPFSVFGPMEGLHRLIPQAMEAMLRNRPLALTPGGQVRDYLFVEDLASALVRAGQCDLPAGSVFNVCGAHGMAMKQFLLSISECVGGDAGLFRFGERPYRTDEMMYFVGDDTRFRRAAGWAPEWDLQRSIAKTYAWYRGVHRWAF